MPDTSVTGCGDFMITSMSAPARRRPWTLPGYCAEVVVLHPSTPAVPRRGARCPGRRHRTSQAARAFEQSGQQPRARYCARRRDRPTTSFRSSSGDLSNSPSAQVSSMSSADVGVEDDGSGRSFRQLLILGRQAPTASAQQAKAQAPVAGRERSTGSDFMIGLFIMRAQHGARGGQFQELNPGRLLWPPPGHTLPIALTIH